MKIRKRKSIYELLEAENKDYKKVCDYCNIGYPVDSFSLSKDSIWECSFCGRQFRKVK